MKVKKNKKTGKMFFLKKKGKTDGKEVIDNKKEEKKEQQQTIRVRLMVGRLTLNQVTEVQLFDPKHTQLYAKKENNNHSRRGYH